MLDAVPRRFVLVVAVYPRTPSIPAYHRQCEDESVTLLFSCAEMCAGNICPTGTGVLTTINYCSSPTTYCPLGSSTYSYTDAGYYAVATLGRLYKNECLCEAGRYCVAGVASACPAGRYGDDTGSTNASCVGVCSAGFYCPAGSTSPTQQPCGSESVYCPQVRLSRRGGVRGSPAMFAPASTTWCAGR